MTKAAPQVPATHTEPTTVAKAVVVGLIAGVLSGLFGIGGGTVIVPGLVMVAGLGQRLAHGTSLAAIVPIALSGLGGFALDGRVDWPVALLLVIGATSGARLGTELLHRVSQHRLRMGFAALLLGTAMRLVTDVPDPGGRLGLDVAAAAGLLVVGVVAGTLAGLLGVGGGVVMVPAQVLLFGIPDAIAKGTSLAVIIPTAVVGTRRNVVNGNADLRLAAIVGLSGVVSAFLASRVAVGLEPTVSSVLFALLLSLVSLRMLLELRSDED
ncbi:MAG TPA: sulfite exporter TauE/SafE family protein [Acidimicrobiales bacterium]